MSQQKNQEIEALRGVAIILAVISHAGNLLVWTNRIEQSQLAFWGGVDIFFVISGFVIASAFAQHIAHARESGNFIGATGSFFVRRIFRIWPTAWLWISVTLLLSIYFNATGIFGTPAANISDLVSIVLNVSNIHFARCISQTDGALLCGNNAQYWSLSVEEQFYILFPLLILLPRKAFYCLTALVVIGWQAAFFCTHWKSTTLFLMRPDSIFLGVSLAWFAAGSRCRDIEPRWSKGRLALPVLALIFLITPVHTGPYRPYTMMVSVVGASMVWMASYDRSRLIADGWVRMALAWVGARSFAIYLIHNPVFWFTRELWARVRPGAAFDHHYAIPFLATALPMLLLLAEINYRVIEMPLRGVGARLANLLSQKKKSGADLDRDALTKAT
jgi:peptidoglycan/LPS O-acetylase OafA/YrhL